MKRVKFEKIEPGVYAACGWTVVNLDLIRAEGGLNDDDYPSFKWEARSPDDFEVRAFKYLEDAKKFAAKRITEAAITPRHVSILHLALGISDTKNRRRSFRNNYAVEDTHVNMPLLDDLCDHGLMDRRPRNRFPWSIFFVTDEGIQFAIDKHETIGKS